MKKKAWLGLLAVVVVGFLNSEALADCSSPTAGSNTSSPSCSYVPTNQTVTIQPPSSIFQGPNDPTWTCAFVTNTRCPYEIMVPYAIEPEWQSFLANYENCASVVECPKLQVSLKASPASILTGGSTTLTWNITGGYGNITCNGLSTDSPTTWPSPSTYTYTTPTGSGIATVAPNPPNNGGSTTYTLSCTDSLTTTVSNPAVVTIDQPISVTLSATPTSVAAGSTTGINYTVTDSSGVPFTCTATNSDGDTTWVTQSPFSSGSGTLTGGPVIVTPAPPAGQTSVTYGLTCNDGLNTGSNSVTVPVTQAYTYVGSGYPACPSACGLSASTVSPTICTQNPGGTSVDVLNCAGQTQACNATPACGAGPPSTTCTTGQNPGNCPAGIYNYSTGNTILTEFPNSGDTYDFNRMKYDLPSDQLNSGAGSEWFACSNGQITDTLITGEHSGVTLPVPLVSSYGCSAPVMNFSVEQYATYNGAPSAGTPLVTSSNSNPNPTYTMSQQTVYLAWQSTGSINTNSCQVTGTDGFNTGAAPFETTPINSDGGYQISDTPPIGTTTYTLTCTNQFGSTTQSITLNVQAASGILWAATIIANAKTHPSSQAYYCYTSPGTPPTPASGGWTFQDTFPGGGPYSCSCTAPCGSTPSYSGTCANYNVNWGGKPSGVTMCANSQQLQSNE